MRGLEIEQRRKLYSWARGASLDENLSIVYYEAPIVTAQSC